MHIADITALSTSVVALAGLGWFFFAPRRARAAELAGGVQRMRVQVRGGWYSPDVIRVRQGVPLEIAFDRQETGECTNRVAFADLGVSAALPAFTTTTVRLQAARAGSFGFACGMNMVHGTLVVEPKVPSSYARHTSVALPMASSVRLLKLLPNDEPTCDLNSSAATNRPRSTHQKVPFLGRPIEAR